MHGLSQTRPASCWLLQVLGIVAGLLWTGGSECLAGKALVWGHYGGEPYIPPEPNIGFTAVTSGGWHCLWLRVDGSILECTDYGHCGEGTVPEPNSDFVAVAGGASHSLGLKRDGRIVAWDTNGGGQINVPAPNADFVAVAAGGGHSLGLKANGSIVAWGSNSEGQCNVPTPNANFVAVAGGNGHSLGLKSDGSIVAWGNNSYGQCNVPLPNSDFVAIAASGYWCFDSGHSLGLKSDGRIVAWGCNLDGQCNVPGPNADFVAMAAGGQHSMGLKSDGSIVAWGNNDFGQCNVPAPNTNFVSIAGGNEHSAALSAVYVYLRLIGPALQIGSPSEVVSFAAEARNTGLSEETYSVSVTDVPPGWSYSYTTPEGTFSGPSTIPLASGNTAPITIRIDSQGNPGTATMRLRFDSLTNPLDTGSISFTKLNSAQVLLVDDDGGETREIPVATTLSAIGRSYGVYDVAWGALTHDDLQDAAEAVIWLTGATSLSLDAAERTLISSYLTGGGRLLLSGQEIAYDLAAPTSPYYSTETMLWFIYTLHCMYLSSSANVYALFGVAGDPLGDGLSFMIEDDGPYAQLSSDAVGQLSGVNFLYYFGMSTWFGGTHFTDGNQYLVYLSFGIEGIADRPPRELLLSRVLDWFGVGAGVPAGEAPPASLMLARIASNPVRPPVTISYELAAAGPVRLRIYDVSGRLVRTLVDGSEPAAEHQRVWNGCDESGGLVPSGVYFYRLEAGGQSATERLVIIR